MSPRWSSRRARYEASFIANVLPCAIQSLELPAKAGHPQVVAVESPSENQMERCATSYRSDISQKHLSSGTDFLEVKVREVQMLKTEIGLSSALFVFGSPLA